MIYATGRTFEHRDTIRELGGWWSVANKRWHFSDLSYTALTKLRACVGMMIIFEDEPEPRPDVYERLRISREDNIPNDKIRIGDDLTYLGWFADNDPLVFAGYSSLGKFVDHVAGLEPPTEEHMSDLGWIQKPEFAGTESMAEAVSIARYGWIDALTVADRLLPPVPLVKRRARSLAGGRVNVGRMLAGAPDHMVRRKRQPGHKIITLFIETIMRKGIGINTAIVRVVAVVAIIDQLEQSGYSCNLIAVDTTRRRDLKAEFQLTIRLKEAGERLNLSDISFALGHPSFTRRLVNAHHGHIPSCSLKAGFSAFIGFAFDDDHQPPRDHYYIPQPMKNITDVWEMIEAITPEGLPITLKDNDQ